MGPVRSPHDLPKKDLAVRVCFLFVPFFWWGEQTISLWTTEEEEEEEGGEQTKSGSRTHGGLEVDDGPVRGVLAWGLTMQEPR